MPTSKMKVRSLSLYFAMLDQALITIEGRPLRRSDCSRSGRCINKTEKTLNTPSRFKVSPSQDTWAEPFTDIHILLNTVHSPSIYNSPASASWIPICLPKFNPAGFVNAYISFLRQDNIPGTPTTSEPHIQPPDEPNEEIDANSSAGRGINDAGIALVCISGGGDFEYIRAWCDLAVKVGIFRTLFQVWT